MRLLSSCWPQPTAPSARGEDKAHGGGTGGEHLLPFRDFHMRAGAAHHGDHEWRAHETLAFGLDMFSPCVRVLDAKCRGDCLAGRTPRLAFKHDEAPRCQLAMIGHPRGDGQERVYFGRGWDRTGEFDRFEGAPGGEEFKASGMVQAIILVVRRRCVIDDTDARGGAIRSPARHRCTCRAVQRCPPRPAERS